MTKGKPDLNTGVINDFDPSSINSFNIPKIPKTFSKVEPVKI
jgi:hypothetical protein